jgi:hypothetical protein
MKNESRNDSDSILETKFFVNATGRIASPRLSSNTPMFAQSSRFVRVERIGCKPQTNFGAEIFR